MNKNDYVLINGELYHYGVPGMRWGHRKARYVTAAQGISRAKAAGREEWRKTTEEHGGKLVGKNKTTAIYKNPIDKVKGSAAAKAAYQEAAKKSIQADKAANKANREKAKAEISAAKAEVKAAKPKKPKVSEMSDSELREKLNRMQMERQYKQLTKREKSLGEKFISEVAYGTAKGLATQYATHYAKQGIDVLIKKATNKQMALPL